MPYKNKADKAAYNKQYYLNNKKKAVAYSKQYRSDNDYDKQHYIKNHKRRTIDKWKRRGLICDDYDALYDLYILATNCNICDVLLTTGKKCKTLRVMDHCHTTGEFRQFLCNNCNLNLKD